MWETIEPRERKWDSTTKKYVVTDIDGIYNSVAAATPERIFICMKHTNPTTHEVTYSSFVSVPTLEAIEGDPVELSDHQTLMDDKSGPQMMPQKMLMEA